MTTPETPTPKATASTLLESLSQVGGTVGVAIQLGEVLIPIGETLAADIKRVLTGTSSVAYSVLVQTDDAELSTIDGESNADIAAINAELTRLGAAPLPTS